MVERDGFEPSKAEPSDLQSDPFSHSGTSPLRFSIATIENALYNNIMF